MQGALRRRALVCGRREVEEMLAESEREKDQMAQKYVSLGEKMHLLAEVEEQTREDAERELSMVDRVLAERGEMARKAKEWRREAKRMERRVAELEAELAKGTEEGQRRAEALAAADKAVRALQEQHVGRTRALEAQVAALKHQASRA